MPAPYRRSWAYERNGTPFRTRPLGRPQPSVYRSAGAGVATVPLPRNRNGPVRRSGPSQPNNASGGRDIPRPAYGLRTVMEPDTPGRDCVAVGGASREAVAGFNTASAPRSGARTRRLDKHRPAPEGHRDVPTVWIATNLDLPILLLPGPIRTLGTQGSDHPCWKDDGPSQSEGVLEPESHQQPGTTPDTRRSPAGYQEQQRATLLRRRRLERGHRPEPRPPRSWLLEVADQPTPPCRWTRKRR